MKKIILILALAIGSHAYSQINSPIDTSVQKFKSNLRPAWQKTKQKTKETIAREWNWAKQKWQNRKKKKCRC